MYSITTIDEFEDVFNFISLRMPLKKINTEPRDWLSWYVVSGLCATIKEGDKILAVVMGQPVARKTPDPFEVDWSGHIMWVELVISDIGMTEVYEQSITYLEKFCGQLTHIAYYRPKTKNYFYCDINRVKRLLC